MPLAAKHKIVLAVGTRPEAIKMAPLALALREDRRFHCELWATGQHREMLDSVLDLFGLQADVDLELMRPNQSLGKLTAKAVAALDDRLAQGEPDLMLVQGDTTSVFCAALAAFYHHVPVGHVEAGLRTNNLQSPWPEEANRVLTSRLARLHFCPTDGARNNLLREGIREDLTYVTGNTVIDALLLMRQRLQGDADADLRIVKELGLPAGFCRQYGLDESHAGSTSGKLILVTGHRRESLGQGFDDICHAIRELVERYSDVGVVYPVHLNPRVQEPVLRILGDHPRIQLIAPQDYETFVWLMDRAYFILSDSGGVQEEAPSLGKPVLVMRDTTERPEAVAAGTCRLVGTDPARIVSEASLLLENKAAYRIRSSIENPYGDGRATEKIVEACVSFLEG